MGTVSVRSEARGEMGLQGDPEASLGEETAQ